MLSFIQRFSLFISGIAVIALASPLAFASTTSGIDTPTGMQTLPLAVEGNAIITLTDKPNNASVNGTLQISSLASCTTGSIIIKNADGSLGCTSPTIGTPLFAQGVNFNTVQAYNHTIATEITREIPFPRSANDSGTAAAWLTHCTITDPSDKDGSVYRIMTDSNNTCRNLVCSGTDPTHRWAMLTAPRGWCLQGQAYSNCPSGNFSVNFGCMFVQSESDINLP